VIFVLCPTRNAWTSCPSIFTCQDFQASRRNLILHKLSKLGFKTMYTPSVRRGGGWCRWRVGDSRKEASLLSPPTLTSWPRPDRLLSVRVPPRSLSRQELRYKICFFFKGNSPENYPAMYLVQRVKTNEERSESLKSPYNCYRSYISETIPLIRYFRHGT